MDSTLIEQHFRKVREFIARKPFCRTGLTDRQLSLYAQALTHDSICNEAENAHVPGVESYERLEFLGDAVVELIACEYVYLNSELREGKMTDFKQEIVANSRISEKVIAYGMDIDSAMLVGNGQRDGRTKSNIIEEKMRADSFEALVGATYILFGLEEAKKVVTAVLF